jgi:hypothetical protein
MRKGRPVATTTVATMLKLRHFSPNATG